MTDSLTPDLSDYFAATRMLRTQLGGQCTFHVPQPPEWPAGTRINPDTQEPYSAMVVRTNPEYVDVVKTVLIILKQGSPLRPQTDERFAEAGMLSDMDIILDVDSNDYADVQAASKFTINGLNYRLEEWKPFSLGNTMYRYLCYGMEE